MGPVCQPDIDLQRAQEGEKCCRKYRQQATTNEFNATQAEPNVNDWLRAGEVTNQILRHFKIQLQTL